MQHECKIIVIDVSGTAGVEIHAAHGYLIAEFLSSYVNKRTDEYGGCFENRVRFLENIYQKIRSRVGNDFPVTVRISANENVVGGRTEAESYELARYLDDLGVDAIHVSNGAYGSEDMRRMIIAPMFAEHAFNADAAEQVKKSVIRWIRRTPACSLCPAFLLQVPYNA